MSKYGKYQLQSDQIKEIRKKIWKVYVFLYKKIDKSINNWRHKEYDYKNANYYDFFKLDYYNPNAFN